MDLARATRCIRRYREMGHPIGKLKRTPNPSHPAHPLSWCHRTADWQDQADLPRVIRCIRCYRGMGHSIGKLRRIPMPRIRCSHARARLDGFPIRFILRIRR